MRPGRRCAELPNIRTCGKQTTFGPQDDRPHRRIGDKSGQMIGQLPTQIRVDNSTSDKYTIVDVFAADRIGLLFTITRTLFEAGISVSVAKIGTYLDQVVDVFYVTDFAGNRIEDEQQIQSLRQKLLDEIAAFEEAAMINA